jgi:GDP-mannose transporter
MAQIVWSANGIIVLAISCVFGCAMSYFAFLARSLVSATSFTVLGTVCKLATVVINLVIWNKHASPTGLLCLSSTLFAAYFYQQAPLREAYKANLQAQK